MAAFAFVHDGDSESQQVLAANRYRDFVTLQLQNTGPAFLAFGEAAAENTGIKLIVAQDSVRVTGAKARGVINAWSDGAAEIGVETQEDVEYRPGPNTAVPPK
jgi:hypothetical protein